MNEFLILGAITAFGTTMWILYGYFEYVRNKRTHWFSFPLLCGNIVLWFIMTLLFLLIGFAKS